MRLVSAICLFALFCSSYSANAETTADTAAAVRRNPILDLLSQYEVVKPQQTAGEGLHLQPLMDNDSNVFPDNLSYSIRAFDKDFHLALQLNKDLISPDYVELRMDKDNGVERRASSSARATNCYYRGRVVGDDTSYVALSACSGLRGVIRAHGELLGIEPAHFATDSFNDDFYATHATNAAHTSEISSRLPTRRVHSAHVLPITELEALEHVVFRDSQITEREKADDEARGVKAARCGVEHEHTHADTTPNNENRAQQPTTATLPFLPIKSSDSVDMIRLFVANDNTRFSSYGEGTEADTLAILNLVSQYYAATNFIAPVRVTLVGQMTFKHSDPYTVRQAADGSGVEVMAGDGLLYTWLGWHFDPANNLPSHNSGQLMSGLMFEDGIRGLAGVGSMCSSQSGSITQMTSQSLHTRAMISAHETGHTLGMEHDGTDNSCPSRGFIMQTVTGEATQFSSCSLSSANAFLSSQTCMAQAAVDKAEPKTDSKEVTEPAGTQDSVGVTSPANTCIIDARDSVAFAFCVAVAGVVLSAVFFFLGRQSRFGRASANQTNDPCEKQQPHIKLVELASPSDVARSSICETVPSAPSTMV